MKKIKSMFLPYLLIVALALAIAGCDVPLEEGVAPPDEFPPAEEPVDELPPLEPVEEPPPVDEPVEEPPPVDEPVEEPPPVDEPVEEPPPVNEPVGMADVAERLSFSHDAMLATDVVSEAIPEHARFTFDGYVWTDTIHQAHIAVYPVDEYEALSEAAAREIEALRQLLAAEGPDMAPTDDETDDEAGETEEESEALEEPVETAGESLPFLPVSIAPQLMTAQVAYLEFQGSAGVRYLTQHGEEIAPINNNELFYTFQGLTDDGRYYISAIFPVSHPGLPATAAESVEGFVEDREGYLAGIVQQLNEADAAAFLPDLSLLDAVITSIMLDGDVISIGDREDVETPEPEPYP